MRKNPVKADYIRIFSEIDHETEMLDDNLNGIIEVGGMIGSKNRSLETIPFDEL